MRHFVLVLACLASLSLTQSAVAFHGHRGYGYGCGGYGYGGYGGYGGYYGGYRGYYGGFYGGGPFYSGFSGPYYSGAYYSGPIYGSAMYSQPYRYSAYYGQPYYSSPTVGQPYAATPVYGAAQATYNKAVQGTAMSANGQISPVGTVQPRPAPLAVTIQDDSFQPASLNVQPGTVVRWTNAGTQVHTVSSQDSRWDSGDLAPGASYSATLLYPGTYHYLCRHHTGMQGTITVASPAPPATTQPSSPAAAPQARAGSPGPVRY